MPTINARNHGIATGRLTKDPVTFENRDGSHKVIVNLALRDNFKQQDGSTGSQFVDFTGYVPKDTKSSVYDMIHKGDLVSVTYELRNDNWTDKSGAQHFDLVLRVTGVDMLEPKSTREARLTQTAF